MQRCFLVAKFFYITRNKDDEKKYHQKTHKGYFEAIYMIKIIAIMLLKTKKTAPKSKGASNERENFFCCIRNIY